jgi:hypothetical protein
LAVLLMVGFQIHELQQLQPEGTFVVHGPADKAAKQLDELLEGKLAMITRKWEVVLKAWNEAMAKLAHILSAAEARGQNMRTLHGATSCSSWCVRLCQSSCQQSCVMQVLLLSLSFL